MAEKKQYGLILKKPKATLDSLAAKKPSVFGDSDDDEPKSKPDTTKKLSASESRVKKQTKLEHARALAQDPTVFEYDSVYDAIEKKRHEKLQEQKKADKDRKPKYVHTLLKTAKQRELDHEAREERKQEKERKEEGDTFQDKEVFVTGAYRKQMEEVSKHRDEQERKDALDDRMGVERQKDLSGFYKHFLNDVISPETAVKTEPEPETKPKEKTKSYRRRRTHSDQSDSEDEQQKEEPPKKSIYSDSDTSDAEQKEAPKLGLSEPKRKRETQAERQKRFFTPTPPSSPEPTNSAPKRVNDADRKTKNSSPGRKRRESSPPSSKRRRRSRSPRKQEEKQPVEEEKSSEELRLEKLRSIFAHKNNELQIEQYRKRYFERKAQGLVVPPV